MCSIKASISVGVPSFESAIKARSGSLNPDSVPMDRAWTGSAWTGSAWTGSAWIDSASVLVREGDSVGVLPPDSVICEPALVELANPTTVAVLEKPYRPRRLTICTGGYVPTVVVAIQIKLTIRRSYRFPF
jgi:hypothetical protein